MMPAPDPRDEPRVSPGAARRRALKLWTRRVHFYLGLYVLLFVWLFSLTGLLLNHPRWELRQFWDQRRESSFEREFTPPTVTGDVAMAEELIGRLGISGEIMQTGRSPDGGRFTVQVSRPGRLWAIDASFGSGRTSIVRTDLNGMGALDALHKFTGVRMDDPGLARDWVLTTIWSAAMDAVAIGLIVMVLSGLYLWVRLKKKRRPGLVALGLGTASCGFFLVGLSSLV